jgi:hypothetical protein
MELDFSYEPIDLPHLEEVPSLLPLFALLLQLCDLALDLQLSALLLLLVDPLIEVQLDLVDLTYNAIDLLSNKKIKINTKR